EACGSDLALCASVCTDLAFDNANCGDCGAACGTGQRCIRGSCDACGADGQLCCTGDVCDTGSTCTGDLCLGVGSDGGDLDDCSAGQVELKGYAYSFDDPTQTPLQGSLQVIDLLGATATVG